jgi:Cof subfamily protein (haloacid dehalogenase superfamily)
MTAIRLVLAEVDGTLLTSSGVLPAGTEHAARRLRDARIELAITSARAPRDMRALIERLRITAPVCAFDGGMLVRPDLSVLEQHALGDEVAGAVISAMERHGLDVSVYQNDARLVRGAGATGVTHEPSTMSYAPDSIVAWEGRVHEAVMIVGVGQHAEGLARCDAELQAHRAYASVARSGPCSLAVTHPRANTGEVVRALGRHLGISRQTIAAIGHAPTDIHMFRECGLPIAMGQARAAVQRSARYVTRSNDDDGFAYAVATWILRTPS